ncbi:hypothetical protein [Calidifontibacter terrae]
MNANQERNNPVAFCSRIELVLPMKHYGWFGTLKQPNDGEPVLTWFNRHGRGLMRLLLH